MRTHHAALDRTSRCALVLAVAAGMAVSLESAAEPENGRPSLTTSPTTDDGPGRHSSLPGFAPDAVKPWTHSTLHVSMPGQDRIGGSNPMQLHDGRPVIGMMDRDAVRAAIARAMGSSLTTGVDLELAGLDNFSLLAMPGEYTMSSLTFSSGSRFSLPSLFLDMSAMQGGAGHVSMPGSGGGRVSAVVAMPKRTSGMRSIAMNSMCISSRASTCARAGS